MVHSVRLQQVSNNKHNTHTQSLEYEFIELFANHNRFGF